MSKHHKSTTITSSLPDKCDHWGKVDVIAHNGGLLVSAGGKEISYMLKEGVVLDLAGHADSTLRFFGSAELPTLRNLYTFTVVRLDWPDMSVPDVGFEFWDALLKDIIDGRHNLTIMCYGGHGRTGTALAILACMLGAVPDNICPVKWVRNNYCSAAVESPSQGKYITEMTGRKVTAKCEKPVTVYSGWKPSWAKKDDDKEEDKPMKCTHGKLMTEPCTACEIGTSSKCPHGKEPWEPCETCDAPFSE